MKISIFRNTSEIWQWCLEHAFSTFLHLVTVQSCTLWKFYKILVFNKFNSCKQYNENQIFLDSVLITRKWQLSELVQDLDLMRLIDLVRDILITYLILSRSDKCGKLALSPKQRGDLREWVRPEQFCDNPQIIYAVSCYSIKQVSWRFH